MQIEFLTDKFGEYHKISMNHQPSGGKTWLALITGPDPKYTLKREFLAPDIKNYSSSGKTGTDTWNVRRDGIYEYNEAWKGRGFFRIKGGELEYMNRDEVILTMRAKVL